MLFKGFGRDGRFFEVDVSAGDFFVDSAVTRSVHFHRGVDHSARTFIVEFDALSDFESLEASEIEVMSDVDERKQYAVEQGGVPLAQF